MELIATYYKDGKLIYVYIDKYGEIIELPAPSIVQEED